MAAEVQSATRKVVSVNPATREVFAAFEPASEQEVDAAVTRARGAQPDWNRIGVERRTGILANFQKLLRERRSEVARIITLETGKPLAEALVSEVLVVLDSVRFSIQHAFDFLREQRVPHGNWALKTKSGRIRREPYGVIGIISPWNYPFSIPATETLAALVTGNAVVLKPSELTSCTALALRDLLWEAGVPSDVFQVTVGDGITGSALLHSPIDKLVFTGSLATGRQVGAAAASRLLPAVLELGGKDPMLVLEDADVDVASSGAVWGAFTNAGQACLSVERCYVDRKLYGPFVAACVEKTGRLRIGDGQAPQIDVGPMISERQLEIVESQIEDAVARGARVLAGGSRLRELGSNFYAPTVLGGVTHQMRVMREETFGPVLPIMAFDSESEAVQLANDSEYGLGASIWTRSRRRGERLAAEIRAGTVMVNDAVSCFGIAEAPHGGMKMSGLGRTHGRWGMEEMVRIQYLDTDLMPGTKKVWWFGYSERFPQQMGALIDLLFARRMGERWRGLKGLRGVFASKERL
ncbi:MAG TPA: aldehyde dehydrogenase family protein [Terriglobales bacterium]|nr:aldehyde dehydrogenase family protein [Terriglobales bacterium]